MKYLFPVPKEDSKRVLTFANHDDFISFRHHTYKKVTDFVSYSQAVPLKHCILRSAPILPS